MRDEGRLKGDDGATFCAGLGDLGRNVEGEAGERGERRGPPGDGRRGEGARAGEACRGPLQWSREHRVALAVPCREVQEATGEREVASEDERASRPTIRLAIKSASLCKPLQAHRELYCEVTCIATRGSRQANQALARATRRGTAQCSRPTAATTPPRSSRRRILHVQSVSENPRRGKGE